MFSVRFAGSPARFERGAAQVIAQEIGIAWCRYILHSAGMQDSQFEQVLLFKSSAIRDFRLKKFKGGECDTKNFAAMLNVDPVTVGRWEKGEKPPSGAALLALVVMVSRVDDVEIVPMPKWCCEKIEALREAAKGRSVRLPPCFLRQLNACTGEFAVPYSVVKEAYTLTSTLTHSILAFAEKCQLECEFEVRNQLYLFDAIAKAQALGPALNELGDLLGTLSLRISGFTQAPPLPVPVPTTKGRKKKSTEAWHEYGAWQDME